MLVISTNTPQWRLLRKCVNQHTDVVILDYDRCTLEKLLTTMQDFSEVPRPLEIILPPPLPFPASEPSPHFCWHRPHFCWQPGKLLSIGFVDHAKSGCFRLLKGLDVDVNELRENEKLRCFFTQIAELLMPDKKKALGRTVSTASRALDMGAIHLLGCNVAADGMELVKELEEITGFNVCASTNETGNVKDGGDWVLETDNLQVRQP